MRRGRVLERELSFAAARGGRVLPPMNFIGGLGGDDVSAEQSSARSRLSPMPRRTAARRRRRMLFLGVDDVDCGGDDSGEGVAR